MEQPPVAPGVATTIITPRKGWFDLGIGELWQYRELGLFLVWRDLKVRYKQTIVGAAWAVINPIVLMVVFTFVFGRFRGSIPRDVPAPVWYFSALLPWSYFAQGLQVSSNSLTSTQHIIAKVYFPRVMLPLAGVMPGLVDFVMSFVVLCGLMLGYDIGFTINMLVIPPLLLMTMLTAFGAGLWLSATNALYRDVREVVPFLVQILLLMSPVIVSRNQIPDWLRPIYGLNPIAGIVEGCRWAVTGVGSFPWDYLVPGAAFLLVLLFSGITYFRRVEDLIVDVL